MTANSVEQGEVFKGIGKEGSFRRLNLQRKKSLFLMRSIQPARSFRSFGRPTQNTREMSGCLGAVFGQNLKKYMDMHRGSLGDMEQAKWAESAPRALSNRGLTRDQFVSQQVKRQIRRNSDPLRSQEDYNKLYRYKFPVRHVVRDFKAHRYSVLTTSITNSTIERVELEAQFKATGVSQLRIKAREFQSRYNSLLKLPQNLNQDVYGQRKRSYFAYFRRKSGNGQTGERPRLKMSICKNSKRDSPEGSRCEEDCRRLGKNKGEQKQEMSNRFPLQGSRCHTNKKVHKNLLIFGQL